MLRRHRSAGSDLGSDSGEITLLVIGYVAIALALIVVGIDVSKVFLAQRSLAAAADAAALAGAEGVDKASLYDGPGVQCGQSLPLSESAASQRAAESVSADALDLSRSLAQLSAPQTAVATGTVTVELQGSVAVPFHQVLGWLDPSRPDGLVGITATSAARSPVAGGGC